MKFKKLLSQWLQRDGNSYVSIGSAAIVYRFGKASHVEAITLSQWGAL